MPTAKNFAVTKQVIGATFNTDGRGGPSMAGSSNTKRKASFGITKHAVGPTNTVNSSDISFPSANKKPPITKDKSSKTGTYSPMKSGPVDMIHSTSVVGHKKGR